MFKPFKPPLLKKAEKPMSVDLTGSDLDLKSQLPPNKKRRLLVHYVPDSPPKPFPTSTAAVSTPRKPLLVINNSIKSNDSSSTASDGPEGYYMVLWRKFTAKKHKTWDGDGILSVRGGYARLQDISGRDMGQCPFRDPLLPGSTLSIGGKEVEVDSVIAKTDFLAGKPFLKPGTKTSASSEIKRGPASKDQPTKVSLAPFRSKGLELDKNKEKEGAVGVEIPATHFYSSTHKSSAMKSQFKNPILSTTVMPRSKDELPTPRHDPDAPGALIMKRPKFCPKGKQIVDVVLDPFLGKHLMEHQREGVKFLYECVMGLRDFNGQGALLADEMGLGKTLQTIALLWTLLKQNPIYGSEGVIKKALIVCPVTLIANWKQEFNKWLGNERIGVFVADGQKHVRLTDFTHGKSYSVMIIGYEKLRSVQDELKKGVGIDIVIADEGHRLKTAQNKSAQAIRALNTDKRVILSGTPLQNDLSEFFVMVDFINPGLLGTYNSFKKEFEGPILKSRQPDASTRDTEKGNAREEELSLLTKQFILRRRAEVMAKYLPPKTEYVIFCKPTQAQVQVYQHVLQSPMFSTALGNSDASLQLITILKKICNAPSLLANSDQEAPTSSNIAQLLEIIPSDLLRKTPIMASSKFRLLDRLLKHLSKKTKEKIVLVSNYTSTLDILAAHLSSLSLPFLRLDGSTPAAKRQEFVNTFNRSSASQSFAFLLSAKSGGTGLNLIGASRLVLFDVDWNPATDLQAMARIHRHGQKRPVKIYRFLTAGGMDEKIFQRQVTKRGLADSVVDGQKNEASFSAEELRDLFRLDLKAACQTHDLLGCDCKGLGTRLLPLRDTEDGDRFDAVEDVNSDGSGEDSDFPLKPTLPLVPATMANVAAIERIRQTRMERSKSYKGKMQALMQYAHLDTTILTGDTKDVFGYELEEVECVREKLGDEVLVEVLKDERCKVSFVFAKEG